MLCAYSFEIMNGKAAGSDQIIAELPKATFDSTDEEKVMSDELASIFNQILEAGEPRRAPLRL